MTARPDWAALAQLWPDEVLLHRTADLQDTAAACRGRLVYLATPYTREAVTVEGAWDPARSAAAQAGAARWARAFARAGVTAISPVVQACAMLGDDPAAAPDPLDHGFWSAWCWPLLLACDAVAVPPLPGRRRSVGIWTEVRAALDQTKPVYLMRRARREAA
ncbi:hypothetical protein BYZ73_21510 [Rhodovulum viride]|uniref:DUF1937 domain-containing protein n=1 Tax=Rhodovulum viride TaxID=1231134 RepID=A0ABX9DAA4_9RHOB|nr:DUF1937 family protein [Rhodovulum viride]RAP39250.1 hypothetical protein BYZ73_21510 [Rhodovulum viride]